MQGSTGKKKNRPFFTPFGLMLFVFSLFYIGAEAVFNMQLLEVAGSVKSNPQEITNLQYFGRTVSAYGFTLLVLGVFENTGFRLRSRRDWALFLGVALVCILPFLSIFRHTFPVSVDGGAYAAPLKLEPLDVMLSIMPCLGLLVAVMSAGRYRPQVFIALLLMAWPAMFLGQKLLIESFVIDRTTWQERQNARYMLMLRAGLEDCAITLGDLQFCDDKQGTADMKAARVIVSALWMMHPDGVLQDLKDNKEEIVERAALKGVWFSPGDQYKKYVEKVTTARDQYARTAAQQFYSKYYAPYKNASDLYLKTLDRAGIEAQAEKAAVDVDGQIDAGWVKYQTAVRDFRQTLSVMVGQAMRSGLAYAGAVNAICGKRGDCPDIDTGPALEQGQKKAIAEFTSKSGYPPTITEKDDFLKEPKTQKLIRDQVQQSIRYKFGMKDFTLPDDWVYDRESFKTTVAALIDKQAKGKWHEKFGDRLPPGLSEKEFMDVLGINPQLPPVESMLLNEEDFFKKYVLPGNKKMIDSMLQELADDRRKHDDNTVATEEGKDYVEALYIPTISLVVSLSVVMMTLFRGLMVLPETLIRTGRIKMNADPRALRLLLAGAFLAALMLMPLAAPNPYAHGGTYSRYLADARKDHILIASLLNWAAQVQPVIYRAGDGLRRAFN
ncbi:MAG: hypothetical protein PW788_16085 [Micavibrio sp.]|nr:hypothetical protein [Micavibrio sp.]